MATPDQEDRGRCVSCGFLAVTAFWSGTPTLRAVDLYQRNTARLAGFPGCFVQAADLYEELREADAKKRPIDAEPGDFGPEDFAAVISRERIEPIGGSDVSEYVSWSSSGWLGGEEIVGSLARLGGLVGVELQAGAR